mmetsp:Transcript_88376/g.270483  ORF Transcript_88376/g.270483 Transcript_88376/m.270483 type:complete len:402 (-) Transcript_88376:425-1630(-)
MARWGVRVEHVQEAIAFVEALRLLHRGHRDLPLPDALGRVLFGRILVQRVIDLVGLVALAINPDRPLINALYQLRHSLRAFLVLRVLEALGSPVGKLQTVGAALLDLLNIDAVLGRLFVELGLRIRIHLVRQFIQQQVGGHHKRLALRPPIPQLLENGGHLLQRIERIASFLFRGHHRRADLQRRGHPPPAASPVVQGRRLVAEPQGVVEVAHLQLEARSQKQRQARVFRPVALGLPILSSVLREHQRGRGAGARLPRGDARQEDVDLRSAVSEVMEDLARLVGQTLTIHHLVLVRVAEQRPGRPVQGLSHAPLVIQALEHFLGLPRRIRGRSYLLQQHLFEGRGGGLRQVSIAQRAQGLGQHARVAQPPAGGHGILARLESGHRRVRLLCPGQVRAGERQ